MKNRIYFINDEELADIYGGMAARQANPLVREINTLIGDLHLSAGLTQSLESFLDPIATKIYNVLTSGGGIPITPIK